MSTPATRGRFQLGPALLLAGLIVLALLLRVWRLNQWGFADDEVFTFRDSQSPSLQNPRPLLYFLNYFLIRPIVPLDELGLRILPAFFGVLTIPVFYLVARGLVGTRAALFGSLLLTFSGFHIYQSQFARYWSLVFLLTAVYPFAIYRGVRERRPGLLALGIVTCVLAALAHPVGIFPLGGLGLFLLTQLRGKNLKRLWSRSGYRWAGLLVAVLTGVILARYVPALQERVSSVRIADHFLHLPSRGGVRQAAFVLSYIENFTLPLVLCGLAGIYVLWRQGSRELAVLLSCVFLFPWAFILLVSLGAAAGIAYLLPSVPVLFIGGGVFLDKLTNIDWAPLPRWLIPATVVALMVAPNIPTILSQYRDGRRADLRGVARWLAPRVGPEDLIRSDQWRTLAHYLPGRRVENLTGDAEPLEEAFRQIRNSGGRGVLWIVSPVSGGLRTNPRLETFKQWVYDHCDLRQTFGVPRLDFRQNGLQVYRCLEGPAAEPSASSR